MILELSFCSFFFFFGGGGGGALFSIFSVVNVKLMFICSFPDFLYFFNIFFLSVINVKLMFNCSFPDFCCFDIFFLLLFLLLGSFSIW